MKKSWTLILVFLFSAVSTFAQSSEMSKRYPPNATLPTLTIDQFIDADQYRTRLLDRFLNYVTIDSQSEYGPNNTFVLSKEVKQAADLLYAELQTMLEGNSSKATLYMSDWKYIYVHIPSNLRPRQAKRVPTLGLSCHYDVTPEAPGHNIKPQVHKNYDGGILWINRSLNKYLDPNTKEDEYLQQLVGETIVTSDGTTLLGADDKAGTSILVTTIQTLIEHPKIPHGDIQIVFTPNEDVGQSAEHLDLEYYHPDISFDFDGRVDGQVMVENFTAVGYTVIVPGNSFHDGTAKETHGLSAIQVASRFVTELPDGLWPQERDGVQDYLNPYMYINEPTDTVRINIRSRFFDPKAGQKHEQIINEVVSNLHERFYQDAVLQERNLHIEVNKTLQYENVAYGISPLAWPIAWAAVTASGATPYPKSVRGGTTTAMFNAKWGITGYTYFTGQQHIHTTYEWLSEKDMFLSYKTALNTILQVVEQTTTKRH